MATMMHDGTVRVFHYYIPSNLQPNESVPLLIALHGLTQTGSGLMDITQFNAIAESERFIVCYPSGLQNAWNANMNVSVSTTDDLGFLEKLVDYFEANFNTNPQRRYLCGMSNGGFMSHKMVCESSYCFAAIASVTGVMSDTTYANCNPLHPTPVLQIHGTADPVVLYSGGPSTGPSVPDMLTKYQQFYGCDPTPVVTPMPNPNLTDLSYPELHSYVNGTVDLKHIKIYGGGHQWPGIATVVGGAGTINMDFYSPQLIWNFLAPKSCSVQSLANPSMLHNFWMNDGLLFLRNPEQVQELQLINLLGQTVFQVSAVPTTGTHLPSLRSGKYFLQINEEVFPLLLP
jgi:polyhydroxybutyrate depolymerase